MARRLPLTAAQEGVWIGQRLDPASPLYNAAEYLEIDGPLEPARVARALRQAVAEAEALHTRYAADADGITQVVDAPGNWTLPIFEGVTRDDAVAWMRDDLRCVVDL